MTDPLTVQFKGRRRFAIQFKSRRANALHNTFRQSLPRDKVRQAAQKNQPVDARENTNFQQSITQIGRRKNSQWAAVQMSVADQNQFTPDLPAFGADDDFCFFFPQGLQPGDEVGQRADFFLMPQVHQFNRPGIKTRSGELSKVTLLARAVGRKFHARQVNAHFESALQNVPGTFNPQWNFEFTGKNIHRAERQHAEPRARKAVRHGAEAVKHLVHRAVTAGGDNQIETLVHGLRREPARVTGGSGGLQRALRTDGI